MKALLEALPKAEDLSADGGEPEGLRQEVETVRVLLNKLTEEERAGLDAALVANLEALEALLAPAPSAPGNAAPGAPGDDEITTPDDGAGEAPAPGSDSVKSYEELAEKIKAGVTNITLSQSFEVPAESATIAVTYDLKLNLNGWTLTAAAGKTLFAVSGSGALTIVDEPGDGREQVGAIEVGTTGASLITVGGDGSFTMAGGALRAESLTGGVGLVHITGGGSFTMEDGTIYAGVSNARPVYMESTGTFTMSGGLIEAESKAKNDLTSVYIKKCTSASLTGGEIKSTDTHGGNVYNLWLISSGVQGVTLDGVTLTAAG